jgi:hypothetical protein
MFIGIVHTVHIMTVAGMLLLVVAGMLLLVVAGTLLIGK